MIASRFLHVVVFCGSCLFAMQSLAQGPSMQTRSGVRHDGPGRVLASNATFAVGTTRDNGISYIGTAALTDTVQIRGEIRPEASHVGQTADVFVVDRLLDTGGFRMRTQDGVWVPWNATVSTLVPYREDVTLTEVYSVEMFAGALGSTGSHRFFLGYLPADGVLRYHTSGLPLTIAESASDRAYGLFVSTISPELVASRCIQCHVAGGLAQAGGAYHIFRQPLADNLRINFDIFQGLVALRGSSHVLTKATGGNSHGGGIQVASGSAEYQSLVEFLGLLAPDVPDPGEEMPQDPYNPNDPYYDY